MMGSTWQDLSLGHCWVPFSSSWFLELEIRIYSVYTIRDIPSGLFGHLHLSSAIYCVTLGNNFASLYCVHNYKLYLLGLLW